MNRTTVFGLATALLMGTAGTAFADNQVGAGVGVDAGADVTLDFETTGAISVQDRSYGTFVSGLSAGTGFTVDLQAFGPQSMVNCVTVTSLQGNTDNALGLDNAISANQAQIVALQGELESHSVFMARVQQSCGLPNLRAADIISVRTSADGQFLVYIDDRGDMMTTGTLGANVVTYGAFVSGLRSGIGLDVDFDSLDEATVIHCVTVSSLEGNTDNAMGLDAAISAYETRLAEFRAQLNSRLGFIARVEQSCPGVANISADHVLGIQQGAVGHFIVYIDDRA